MKLRDYIFVVGCPRSGTTLLSVMLDRHTRISVPSETAFFVEIAGRLWYRSHAGVLELLRQWPRLRELKLEPEAVVRRLGQRRPLKAELLATILDLWKLLQTYAHKTSIPAKSGTARRRVLLATGAVIRTDVSAVISPQGYYERHHALERLSLSSEERACRHGRSGVGLQWRILPRSPNSFPMAARVLGARLE